MVYITAEQFEQGYKKIIEGSANAIRSGLGVCSVLFLVANDTDALCGLRILTTLLRQDFISYKIVPVRSVRDIVSCNENLIVGNEELQTIVMINCGGSIDIQEKIEIRENVTVIIIDNHRPYNLYNIYWNENVLVFDDGDLDEEEKLKTAFNYLEFNDQEEAENGAQEGEGEGEEEFDGEDRHTRKKLKDTNEIAEDFIKQQKQRSERRKERDEAQAIIAEYYSQGQYYGQSAAITAYQILEQMGKPQGMDTVWWAILGLTTQYISEQIDEEGYQLVVNSISDTVAQLNDSSVPGSGNNSGNGEQIAVDLSTSSKLIMNSKQPTCSIQPSEEFRFFMLRHWSLENSMQYSSFIVSRLGTWSARGKSVFRLVIAKLGLAISEIQQSYTHLDPKLKSELPVRWDRVSSDYNLENAMFNSFVRTYGWKMPPISAADHVCVSNALLIDSTVVADWKVAFYKAYDCLANLNVLHTGLSCALKTQQSLVDLACSMLDQKLVKTLSKFRLAVINLPFSSTSTSSLLSSESHLMLIQLGNLLIDALRNHGNPAHAKLPFILAYYDPQSLAYTVFGLTPPEYHASAQLPPSTSTYSGDLRNKFGLIFELSATDCGAEITNSYFDTCIVSITESKFKTFIDKLRKHL